MSSVMAMAKGKMRKSSGTILARLPVIVVLAAGVTGCGAGVSGGMSARDLDPFVTDRVVTVRIVMAEEDWTACQTDALAEEYVRADFWFDGELVPDVAVRPKGNSSLQAVAKSGSPRLSLKVDFNFFDAARTFHGLKKVNFNNGFSDPTLIREYLAYELYEQMGVPTPRASFVDLWVNDTHLGVYTMVEQIDKTFLGEHFSEDDGNLYKPEGTAAALNWTEADLEEQRAVWGTSGQDDSDSSLDVNLGGGKLSEILRALELEDSTTGEGVASNLPFALPQGQRSAGQQPAGQSPGGQQSRGQQSDYLEAMALKTNENNPDHSALLRFLEVLNNEPDETFPEEIEKVLDVDEVLRFLAVSTLIVHLDNYIGMGHNYYLYEVDGKFAILPWDLNMAFGTFNSGIDREGIINFFIDEPTAGPIAERPLVERLLSYQPYLEAYHGYLEALLEGPFSVEAMESRIDELADMIRPYVEADELKFYSTEDFERSLSEDIRSGSVIGGMTPIGLKTFVVERNASVRQQLDGDLPSAGDGSGNEGNWAPGNRQMPLREPIREPRR
jgi:spore coat protein CotH